jgi:hypothetical protein
MRLSRSRDGFSRNSGGCRRQRETCGAAPPTVNLAVVYLPLGYQGVKSTFDSQIAILIESRELWNVNTAAYCLMSNHYYLLAQTPEANLSRYIRRINGIYTGKLVQHPPIAKIK